MRTRAIATIALVLAGGCEIAEVATPEGSDVLVVEGIVRAGADRQHLLLHRALNGSVVRGEPDARVTVREVGGEEHRFEERPRPVCTEGLYPEDTDSLAIEVSCYESPPELRVEPGGSYELLVETVDGGRVRGRTSVPGAFRLRTPAPPADGPPVCSLPPYTNLTLVWTPADGAWSYLVGMEITGLRRALAPLGISAPERLELTGVSISRTDTTLVVPAEVGLFERADVDQEILQLLQRGFPPGVSVRLAVLAADRNYVNGVRGGGFNPSGNIRISSVVGDGIGVFGSAVPLEVALTVGVDGRYPDCAG